MTLLVWQRRRGSPGDKWLVKRIDISHASLSLQVSLPQAPLSLLVVSSLSLSCRAISPSQIQAGMMVTCDVVSGSVRCPFVSCCGFLSPTSSPSSLRETPLLDTINLSLSTSNQKVCINFQSLRSKTLFTPFTPTSYPTPTPTRTHTFCCCCCCCC